MGRRIFAAPLCTWKGELPIQEEVTQKTIALVVSAAKMTGRVLAQAMQIYLQSQKDRQHEIPKGKQSLADLEKQNAALSNIEITNKNIGSFNRTAKKYEIDFALKKDRTKEPPLYYVFFKGRDEERISMAFNEYSQKILKRKEKKSVREELKQEKAAEKAQNRRREKVKVQDRGVELWR